MNNEQVGLMRHLIDREYLDQEDDEGPLYTKVCGKWLRRDLKEEMSIEKMQPGDGNIYTDAFDNKVPDDFEDIIITAFKDLGMQKIPDEDDAWAINRNAEDPEDNT